MSSNHRHRATLPPDGSPDASPYQAFFRWFDAGRYYEAHDALEPLWLRERRQPDGDFYQALIQVAGAFVHLQKNRGQPAERLLARAETILARYPSPHRGLDVHRLRRRLAGWREGLAGGLTCATVLAGAPPPLVPAADSPA